MVHWWHTNDFKPFTRWPYSREAPVVSSSFMPDCGAYQRSTCHCRVCFTILMIFPWRIIVCMKGSEINDFNSKKNQIHCYRSWKGPAGLDIPALASHRAPVRLGFVVDGLNNQRCCGFRKANFISCHLAIMWKLHWNNGPHVGER